MDYAKKLTEIIDFKRTSRSALAAELGAAQNTFNRHFDETQQDKLAVHFWKILEIYDDISREWLFFDEGPMLKRDAALSVARMDVQPVAPPAVQEARATRPMPLIGFASCGVGGWYGTMSIPVPVDPPQWHDEMIAVMASGESMLPAGIGHGHVCYCDPTKEPGIGEAVYVEQKSGQATLKLFSGKSMSGGTVFLNLRGWLDKKPDYEGQKPFNLDVSLEIVARVAPVIYVRRRL